MEAKYFFDDDGKGVCVPTKRSNILFISAMHLLFVVTTFMSEMPTETLALCCKISGFSISLCIAAGATLNNAIILYLSVACCLCDVVLQTFVFSYKFIESVSGPTVNELNVIAVARILLCILSVLLIFPYALNIKYGTESVTINNPTVTPKPLMNDQSYMIPNERYTPRRSASTRIFLGSPIPPPVPPPRPPTSTKDSFYQRLK